MPAEESAGDGGFFGAWSLDTEGLPCFDYRPTGGGLVVPHDDPLVPWHLVGDSRLKVTAHAGGWLTLYSVSNGFVRLAGGTRKMRSWRIVDSQDQMLLDPVRDFSELDVRFGCGYTEWFHTNGDLKVLRRITPGPQGFATVVVTYETELPDGAKVEEFLHFDPYPLIVAPFMSKQTSAYPDDAPLVERLAWNAITAGTSLVRLASDGVRALAGKTAYRLTTMECRSFPGLVISPSRQVPSPEGPVFWDRRLPVVVVTSLDGFTSVKAERRGLGLGVRLVSREGGGSMRFMIGILEDGEVETSDLEAAFTPIRDVAAKGESRPPRRTGIELAKKVTAAATNAIGRSDREAIEREAEWHASYLRSLMVRDDYFEARYPMQGSAYSFVHGLQGAPRDYAISAVVLSRIDPPASQESLEVIMRMTRTFGGIHYAHTGYGQCISGQIHAYPTDLPIFLLWAIHEYVTVTGDRRFLDREIPFYKKEKGVTSTVRERIVLAFEYLKNEVGRGEHGMLRVGSGDWSDPITAMAPDRGAFHERGESGFNTAFAAYVLPLAADLVRGRSKESQELADQMSSFASDLRLTMENAWNGRWFYRGWDGLGNPLGDQHLFLDGQVWPLVAKIGTEQMRRTLIGEIRRLLIEPSKIGATILDRPHPVRFGILPPGWDCNGGVWAAIGGLLVWGLASHDKRLAWRELRKQTLFAHARAYPRIWYGIWSGPDAYNSYMGVREGETFVQPATPMVEYPVMNSNAHAGPLLGLIKLLEVAYR